MCANKNVIIAAAGIILLSMIIITGCTGAEKTGGKKIVQIDENAKLQQEVNQLKIENTLQEKIVKAYEKSVTDLRLALGTIITLALAAIGLLVFKNTREYKEAKDEAKEAAKEAKETAKETKEIAKEAVEWVEKARQKYEDIETKGDKIIEGIVKKAEAERKKSQEEAGKQRKLSELWAKEEKAYEKGRYEESGNYCHEIITIKPDEYWAWNNWGLSFLDLSKKKEGKEKEKFLQEAREKLLRAEQIKKGTGAYNLACIAAEENNEEECKEWLKTGEEAGTLQTREFAMKDDDLKAYWDKDWFKAIKWKGEK